MIDPTELKNFLNYLSDQENDADEHEVDQAIDRFLKEKSKKYLMDKFSIKTDF